MDCTRTRACPSSAPSLSAASRVYPTCGVKPGNDVTYVVRFVRNTFSLRPDARRGLVEKLVQPRDRLGAAGVLRHHALEVQAIIVRHVLQARQAVGDGEVRIGR